MAQEHFYEVSVEWLEGRKGTLRSNVLNQTIEVATPPDFPNGIQGIWSPEHLFVAAVNSCLMTTFLAIAENSRLVYSGFTSKAVGKLALVDGKYVMNEIKLMPTVTIPNEDGRERATRILQQSKAACLISNSIKSQIILEPTVITT